MTGTLDRRQFLGRSGFAAGTLAFGTATGWAKGGEAPSDRIVVGVMGLARGKSLATGFTGLPGVTVKYACDVDRNRAEAGADAVAKAGGETPVVTQDFRTILDDPEVDALVCAAPNHWHAPATILACQAGKHVYVEKPCCHNPQEGEWMVRVARDHDRVVQMGTQRRSSRAVAEAIAAIRDGVIGRVYHARAYYFNSRGSIGRVTHSAPPTELDYELWQGPAPRRPFSPAFVHYNWHWFWHYGNGELGNNGVHALDLCRWGLDVTYPTRVVSNGGRYAFDDDQETPDTHTVAFSFDGGVSIDWQGLSCNRHGHGPFVSFFGSDGALDINGGGDVTRFDARNREVERIDGNNGDREHLANFVEAIREQAPNQLNAEILDGYRSTLLCLLGNIAHRVDRVLTCDPESGRILNDGEAMAHWAREYDERWAPKVG